jgi:signal transduction histidine kinase/CheY-like chemotaxis protein
MRGPRRQKPAGGALRRRAEGRLGKGTHPGPGGLAADPARLVHELQVHQVELELQNDELRRTRDELEASLARVTELYDFAPVGYLTLDRRGVILEANLRSAGLLERERAVLVGVDLGSLLAPESRATFEGFLRTALARGGHRFSDVLVRRPGGEATPVQLEAISEEEGGREGWRCKVALVDVSEQRKLEAYARQAARLEAVALLAAGVAHEINNPLTYVLEGLVHLEEELASLLPPRPDLLEAAHDGGEGVRRIREVVQSLRALSNPKLAARTRVDPRRELESALLLASNELRHRAQVVTRLDPTPAVEASPHELGRAFLSLLVNAAAAGAGGGADGATITIGCGEDGQGWAFVEVQDTGQGMTPEVLERVFEPFYSTRPRAIGDGFGLALAHSVVTGLGGRVEVTSKPGVGSTFRVCLPPVGAHGSAEAKAAPAAPAAPGAGPARRWNVLVVDDEPKVARAAVRCLGDGCTVTTRGSGVEVLELLAGGAAFDVVLCDLMMPAMTGHQLHQHVAARWPAQASRFVFLTGGVFTPEAQAFLDRSGCPRMEKPFEAAALRAEVERIASAGEERAHRQRGELP